MKRFVYRSVAHVEDTKYANDNTWLGRRKTFK